MARTKAEKKAVGPYPLLSPLGWGGAGVVYRSVDPDTRQPVAVKLLGGPNSPDARQQFRFTLEFQAAHKLDHPNIARALEYGVDGEQMYLVMELVEGETFGDLIAREKRVAEGTAVRVCLQVAQALHFAHTHKVIHRDVKPDNILLRADGQVKLTDFGLSKDLDNDLDLTNPAAGLGTPHFMAPEQYEGAKAAGPLCDVYALAATLYTALTGVMPFEAYTSLIALTRKLKEAPPSPRAVVPEVSETVDAAVRQGLHPDPRRRPSSVLNFARLLAGQPMFGRRRAGVVRLDDRRREVRHPRPQGVVCVVLSGSMSLAAADNDQWPAVVRDVSTTGVGVLLARRFEVGTQLLLPLQRYGSRKPLEVWAEVVRVEPDRYGHWFHGCKTAAPLSDDDLARLARR
jgi:serine/threonine protein kinase